MTNVLIVGMVDGTGHAVGITIEFLLEEFSFSKRRHAWSDIPQVSLPSLDYVKQRFVRAQASEEFLIKQYLHWLNIMLCRLEDQDEQLKLDVITKWDKWMNSQTFDNLLVKEALIKKVAALQLLAFLNSLGKEQAIVVADAGRHIGIPFSRPLRASTLARNDLANDNNPQQGTTPGDSNQIAPNTHATTSQSDSINVPVGGVLKTVDLPLSSGANGTAPLTNTLPRLQTIAGQPTIALPSLKDVMMRAGEEYVTRNRDRLAMYSTPSLFSLNNMLSGTTMVRARVDVQDQIKAKTQSQVSPLSGDNLKDPAGADVPPRIMLPSLAGPHRQPQDAPQWWPASIVSPRPSPSADP